MMKQESRALNEIKPYANNPRENKAAIKYVVSSIRRFGFLDPIEIDETGEILAGHTRFLAGKKMKLKAVPVLIHAGLTTEQKRAYRIANNSTGEIAEWNEALLKAEIGAVNFNMALFGIGTEALTQAIKDNEIEKIIDDFDKLQPDRKPGEKAGPGSKSRWQITITGPKAAFTDQQLKFIKGLYAIGAKVEIKEI